MVLSKLKNNRSVSKLIQRFADVHDLVDFGKVSSRDDLERVTGATFSPNSVDTHYMHGSVNNYETTMFTRKSIHASLEEGDMHYDWTAISVELNVSNLPHVVIDNKKHDKKFFTTLFTRFPKLRVGNQVLKAVNPSAEFSFDIFISPEDSTYIGTLLDDEIFQRMNQYFAKFDVEIDRNRVTVFTRNFPTSIMQLNEMLTEAQWLAFKLEMKSSYGHIESYTNQNTPLEQAYL